MSRTRGAGVLAATGLFVLVAGVLAGRGESQRADNVTIQIVGTSQTTGELKPCG